MNEGVAAGAWLGLIEEIEHTYDGDLGKRANGTLRAGFVSAKIRNPLYVKQNVYADWEYDTQFPYMWVNLRTSQNTRHEKVGISYCELIKSDMPIARGKLVVGGKEKEAEVFVPLIHVGDVDDAEQWKDRVDLEQPEEREPQESEPSVPPAATAPLRAHERLDPAPLLGLALSLADRASDAAAARADAAAAAADGGDAEADADGGDADAASGRDHERARDTLAAAMRAAEAQEARAEAIAALPR